MGSEQVTPGMDNAGLPQPATFWEDKAVAAFGTGYSWYVVGVLTLCYVLSFMDRQILSLLVGPIKRDLGISDTRVGLLQGLAFALFYTLAGFPIGRLVDIRNRRNLVMAGLAIWSAFTCACSTARSFFPCFSRELELASVKRR